MHKYTYTYETYNIHIYIEALYMCKCSDVVCRAANAGLPYTNQSRVAS